jgi:hypothetical protein
LSLQEVEFEIDDSDWLQKSDILVSSLPDVKGQFLDEGSIVLQGHFIIEMPKRTGRMASTTSRDVGDNEAVIGTTTGYGLFVDQDTQPHIIEPVFAAVLAFEVDGVTRFARRVQHPGTTGQHFRDRTIVAAKSDLVEVFKRVIGYLFDKAR